jgi:predicted amidohydrolase
MVQCGHNNRAKWRKSRIPEKGTVGLFGILICREIVVPSLWTTLKSRGVRVVFHLNNALKREDHIWRHLLIARAVENGIFVCSINARGPAYGLGSFVISPRGDVLLHIPSDEERVSWTEMDLSQVVDDFR